MILEYTGRVNTLNSGDYLEVLADNSPKWSTFRTYDCLQDEDVGKRRI